MKEYKQAFDNIKVPEDMATRIEKKLAETPAEITPISSARPRKKVWITLAACAACCALIVGVWELGGPGRQPQVAVPEPTADQGGAVSQPNTTAPQPTANQGGSVSKPHVTAPEPTEDQGATVANPIQNVNSPEELEQYLGFAPALPSSVPEGYTASYSVIGGKLAQAEYTDTDGENRVLYRTAKGSDDVSGDYGEYAQVSQNGIYTLKGEEGTVSLVNWTDGGYSFSLSFSPAAAPDAALSWAKSVR